jgi:hypothetical protein
MYSSVLSDTFSSWENDRDHAHVFYKSHTMVLLKINGLAYPLLCFAQKMDTHSCDALQFSITCTKHLPFFLYLYSNFTEMLSSSGIVSALPLPQLDLSSYTSFPLVVVFLAKPHLDSRNYVSSKDSSSVEIKS